MKAVDRSGVWRTFALILVGSSVAFTACHSTPELCQFGTCDDSQTAAAGLAGSDGAVTASAGFGGSGEDAGSSAAGFAEIEAGKPGMAQDAAGQGGGDGSAADCATDADCSDSKRCNGIERCSNGECRPGVAVACAAGSDCVESGTGANCQPNAGFLTYVGDDARAGFAGLVGLPLEPTADSVAIDLSRGALDKDFHGVDEYSWAPDGRRLIFDAVMTDFATYSNYRFYWIEMSARTPGAALRIENLPVSSQTSFKGWSPDSSAALIADGHDLYAVRFQDGSANAVRISDAFQGEAYFCADGSTVAYGASDKTYLVSAWAAGSKTVLDQQLVSAAPDAHWLLLSSNEHAYLAQCALGAQSEALGDAALGLVTWSDDSKYVAYTPSGGLDEVLSVWPVAGAGPRIAAFTAEASDSAASWQPGGDRLLYSTSGGEHWYVEDLSSTAPALELPIAGQLANDPAWAYATGSISYSTTSGDASDYYLFPASLGQQSKLVLHDSDSSVSDIWYSSGLSQAVYVQNQSGSGDARAQAFVIDLEHPNSAKRALFETPLAGDVQLSHKAAASGNELILTHAINAPEALQELYFVPQTLSAALKISHGTYAYDAMLRPTP